MTEAESLACADPTSMLESLRGKASDRKLRLLLCSMGRLMPDGEMREEEVASIRVAEGYADSQVSLNELNDFRNQLKRILIGGYPKPLPLSWSSLLLCARKMLFNSCFELCARTLRARVVEVTDDPAWERNRQLRHSLLGRERPVFATLLRDIFGPLPFRSVSVDPDWRTSTVLALARGAYEDRAFDRLPILADALQDAGCENADILNHCRADTPHVRGCWIVDLVLGKE